MVFWPRESWTRLWQPVFWSAMWSKRLRLCVILKNLEKKWFHDAVFAPVADNISAMRTIPPRRVSRISIYWLGRCYSKFKVAVWKIFQEAWYLGLRVDKEHSWASSEKWHWKMAAKWEQDLYCSMNVLVYTVQRVTKPSDFYCTAMIHFYTCKYLLAMCETSLNTQIVKSNQICHSELSRSWRSADSRNGL